MRLRVGVFHTPLYRFQRKWMDIFRFQVYSFIPYGMFVGRMQYAPTRVGVLDRWAVWMFLRVGVFHMPFDRFQRKRMDVFRFQVYSFIPCGMIVGRKHYAPTRVRVFDRC